MKRKGAIAAAAAFAVMLVIWFFANRTDPVPSGGALLTQIEDEEMVRQTLDVPLTEGCLDSLEQVEDLELDLLEQFPPRLLELPTLRACEHPPPEMVELFRAYHSKCDRLFENYKAVQNQEQWHRRSVGCLRHIFLLKAAARAWFTRNEEQPGYFGEKILTIKLLGLMALYSAGAPIDFEKMAELSERMLELYPDEPEAAKTVLISRLHNAVEYRNSIYREEFWFLAEKAYERLKRLDLGDSLFEDHELEEILVLVRSRGFRSADGIRRGVAELAREHPDSGLADYYSGYLEWRSGSLKKAQAYLRRALSIEPDEERYSGTLASLSRKQTHVQPGELGKIDGPFELVTFNPAIAVKLGLRP